MNTRNNERESLTPGYPVQAPPPANDGMSYPQQPGYNPAYQNPYQQGQGAPPPPGFNTGNQGYPPPPPMPHGAMMNHANLLENGQSGDGKYSFQFNDQTIRAAFIRKVFALVFIMLSIVATMTAIPWLDNGFRATIQRNTGLYLASYAVFFVTYLTLVCCEGPRRKFPLNLIVTTIFTLATGCMTMVICVQYRPESVLMALATCIICTFCIVIFASQTKFDMTANMGYIAVASLCFIIFGFVAILTAYIFKIKFMLMVYAFFGALIMMVYLFLDIQLMMGGKKYEISPEDYIFAAVQIFVDIVQLFWYLLTLFGSRN